MTYVVTDNCIKCKYMDCVWRYVPSTAGLLVFFFGLAYAFARKEHAPANPWGAGATTLEWTLPSPAPFHSFETLPRFK